MRNAATIALPIAMAVLIVAVLMVTDSSSPPVAEAHSGHDDLACDGSADAPEICDTFPRPPVYLATMQVKSFTTSGNDWLGCSIGAGTLDQCGIAISHDQHTLRAHNFIRLPESGRTHTLWALRTTNTDAGPVVQFVSLIQLPEAFKAYTLYLGDVALPVDAASRFEQSTIARYYHITNIVWQLTEPLGWAEGDDVNIFLVPPLWAAELTVGETHFGLGCGAPRTPSNSGASCGSSDLSVTGIDFRNEVNVDYINLRYEGTPGGQGPFSAPSDGSGLLRFAVDRYWTDKEFLTLVVDGTTPEGRRYQGRYRLADGVEHGCHYGTGYGGADRTGDCWDSGADVAFGDDKSNKGHVVSWPNSGLNWAVGDKVGLSLVYQPTAWWGAYADPTIPYDVHFRERPRTETVTYPYDPGDGTTRMETSVLTDRDVLRTIVRLSEPAPPGGVTFTLSADPASTATEGTDFELLTPKVTLPHGRGASHEADEWIRIRIIDDDHEDSGETIILNIRADKGYETKSFKVTILNDDAPLPEGAMEAKPVPAKPAKQAGEPEAAKDPDTGPQPLPQVQPGPETNLDGISVPADAVPPPEPTPTPTPEPQRQVQAGKPGAVAGLNLVWTHNSVTLSWGAPESGGEPERYLAQIKRADGKGRGKDRRVKAGKTTTTFRNLQPGTTYNVWVRAQNGEGKGPKSHASATLPPKPKELATPTGSEPQPQQREQPTATPTPTTEPTATPTSTPTPEPEQQSRRQEQPTATPTPEPTATPTATAAPEPGSEPENPYDAWLRYDADGSGCIDQDELMKATHDYAAGKIEYLEILSVVRNRC